MFSQITSFENLLLAFKKAEKAKKNNKEVLKFSYNLENNLLELKNQLETGTYIHGKYQKFIVNDSKRREIKAALSVIE